MERMGDSELEAEGDKAYEMMRGWQWVFYDPDGVASGKSMDLSTALNRLAFEGHQTPKRALLTLLRQGRLTAECSYRWRKYKRGDFFSL